MGHVGAGKSSLISALLGEMEKMDGRVLVKVTILTLEEIFIVFVVCFVLRVKWHMSHNKHGY